METHYPTINVPATPEYVLSVIHEKLRRDNYEFSTSALDDFDLTLDSTFDELYATCEFYSFDDMLYSTSDWFDLNIYEWMSALQAAELRTARDFCELIAAQITVPVIQLCSFGGRHCRPASAFLTIRSILHDAGVNVTDMAPSTSLKEYTRKHIKTFLGPIAKLAPGSLPDVDIDDGGFHRLELLKELWSIPMLVAFFTKSVFPGFFVFALCMWLILILKVEIDSKEKYKSVQFGDLKTFRDLSMAIANHPSVKAVPNC